MAATVISLGPIITVLLAVVLVVIALRIGKSVIWLLVNSLIGVALLVIINFLPFVNIPINVWSVLIVALGGVPGIVLLVLLDLLKIAF